MKHFGRQAMRLFAVTLLVAGSLLTFTGPATAQDAQTITVDPATVAAPGSQEFTVTGSGFSEDLFVLSCIVVEDLSALNATGGDCDLVNLVSVTPEADGSFEATATFEVPADGFSIVAGNAAQTESAYVNVFVEAGGDDAAEAPSGPTLTVEPAMAVPGETEFTVTGSGFTKNVFVLSCIPTDDPSTLDAQGGDCDLANLVPATPDADGSFVATLTVDVPPEGISIIAGDADQTESGFANVAIDEEAVAAAEAEAEAEAAAEAEAEAEAEAAAAEAEAEAAAAAEAEADEQATTTTTEAASEEAADDDDESSSAGAVTAVIVIAAIVVIVGVMVMRRRSGSAEPSPTSEAADDSDTEESSQ